MPAADTSGDGGGARQRVDRWLWHARFFRSRSLATAAVAGGLVHVNGERVRASRGVAPGDRLDITAGNATVSVEVLSLPPRRGPATEARACYRETADSIERREQRREQSRFGLLSAPSPQGRPDKRMRRAIRRLQGRD